MLGIVTCLKIKIQCKMCASDVNLLTNVTSIKIQMHHKVLKKVKN